MMNLLRKIANVFIPPYDPNKGKAAKEPNPEKNRAFVLGSLNPGDRMPNDMTDCPDCGSPDNCGWYEGPSGGGSQNMICAGCGARVNVMGPIGTDYIGPGNPKSVGAAT